MKRWRPRAMPTTLAPWPLGDRFLMLVTIVARRRTVTAEPWRVRWSPPDGPLAWFKVTDTPPRPRVFVNRETGAVYWWDAGDLAGYLRACELAGATLNP